MTKKKNAEPGTWTSNIDAFLVANGSARLADLRRHKSATYWLESVAAEQGRMTIIRHQHGETESILPQPFNVRSKVHEYGGAPYCLSNDAIYFVNARDQAIYRIPLSENSQDLSQLHSTPEKIYQAEGLRFGDLIWAAGPQTIIAVCEQHQSAHSANSTSEDNTEVLNRVVSIDLNGQISTLTSGADFYAYPRYDSTQGKLCWITWDHPNMPWDKTTLWTATLNQDGSLSEPRALRETANSENSESIVQPTWADNGDLFYISDRNNWWNVYRQPRTKKSAKQPEPIRQPEPIKETNAEYATPLWVLGMQQYAIADNTLYAAKNKSGQWSIECIDLNTLATTTLPHSFSAVDSMWADKSGAYFIASTPSRFASVYKLDSDSHELSVLSECSEAALNELSSPESMFFNTSTGDAIHAFYYPPFNSAYHSEKSPPLIVLCHGGPTGQTSSELNYKIQYWTNRGFAVVDVNYRGSTGFGRSFRKTLYKQWGVFDVEDVVTVVDQLIADKKADKNQIIIKGSSAGGYTVLAALAFSKRFNAGVSLYGIGDLTLLATDTHKFEKYYLEQLIGAYPSEKELYKTRSPINSSEQLDCPILLFQGLEDNVVPPNQARIMAEAVEKKGLPVALVEFPDEGHGFRSPKNIEHMLEVELYFYQKIFNFGNPEVPKGISLKNVD